MYDIELAFSERNNQRDQAQKIPDWIYFSFDVHRLIGKALLKRECITHLVATGNHRYRHTRSAQCLDLGP